jgi:hypothetical protein
MLNQSFTFCLPCIMQRFLVNDQREAQIPFYVFIFLFMTLYMFRTHCTRHGHQHRVTVTRGCIDKICLS